MLVAVGDKKILTAELIELAMNAPAEPKRRNVIRMAGRYLAGAFSGDSADDGLYSDALILAG